MGGDDSKELRELLHEWRETKARNKAFLRGAGFGAIYALAALGLTQVADMIALVAQP